MDVILWIYAGLFAFLHVIAALALWQQGGAGARGRAAGTLLGAVEIAAAVALSIAGSPADGGLALTGALIICAIALTNGMVAGKVHWMHHGVRALLAAAMVIGFFHI